MASSSASASAPVGLVPNPTTPEYRNWLLLGHALTTVLCQGLRPFIKREMEDFYNNIKAAIAAAAAGPCTCVHVPRRKFHDMRICAWANTLQVHHRTNRPNWKQSDSSKWIDPNLGPWEIAMLFLPDLGGHVPIQGPDDMDITGILNLMYWCDHFAVQQPLIKDVREVRNAKWVHVPKLELSDADKKDAFDTIEKLLQDPELVVEPDAQKALQEIVNLKNVSNFHSMEAQVLTRFKEVIDKEILDIKKKSVRDEEQRNELILRQLNLEEALEEVNQQVQEKKKTFTDSALDSVGCLLSCLTEPLKGIKKRTVIGWMILLLLFSSCSILDDTFNIDGCTMTTFGDPLQLKHFDFRDLINSTRVDFIGRQWLYREVESILEQESNRGVLISGNPGSGKSAFVGHLICTKTSSPFFHNKILGYHFCMHSDKGTQNGAKFVRNLANMIAWRFHDYRDIITSDSFVHRVLHSDCPQDPEWCFDQGIVIPLKSLRQQPKHQWYVVIDALDECSTDKAEILNILKSKIRRLPVWLKLIMTSRDVTSITTSLNGVQKVELRSDDERNLEDIYTYLSLKVFSLKASTFQRIKTAFSITDNNAPTQKLVASLAEKAQGNFLFVKVALEFWLSSTVSVCWENFPKSLDSTFQLYFERKYGSHESFQSLREIFEILVAAYTPISAQQMHSMLQFDHPTLDFEYDFMPKLDEVSLFLWHGSDKGLVQIYHASLSEWLTSEANKGKFYYVKRRNGHNRLAKFYLQTAQKNRQTLTPEEALHLASHVVEGGSAESEIHQFLSMPSNQVNSSDPVTKTNALHLSSSIENSEVSKLLTNHFSHVDCFDNNQRTPALIAASSGNLDTLISLFKKGANLNHTVTCVDIELAFNSYDPLVECKRKLCGYSLLHAAAQQGHARVVSFLTEHQTDIFKTTRANNTAVQLAAENGHLETVKRLRKAGGVLDGVSLHHAAIGGHNQVVQYLLKEGVKDTCIDNNFSYTASNKTDNDLEGVGIHLYDNQFMFLGETALHAAAGKEHISVLESLLSQYENAVKCPNAAGRRPLHEAVDRNNYDALKAMLDAGADTSVYCNSGSFSSKKLPQLSRGRFAQKPCPCGFTPLHTAAMHGNHSVAKLLIKYGSDVNSGDCNGSTPLHVASCEGMLSLVTLLVRSGANISATSSNGSTPLHSAAACLALTAFRPLLDLGADFFVTDNKGWTALLYIVKDIDIVGSEYFADLYVSKPIDWIEVAAYEKQTLDELYVQYPWLSALIEMIKSFASTESARIMDYDDIQVNGLFNAMLHTYSSIFSMLGQRANASFVLTGTNLHDDSRLVYSISPLFFAFDLTMCEFVRKKLSITRKRPYEPPSTLEYLKSAMSKSFAALLFKVGIMNCSVLNPAVTINMVYTVDVILQAGADVNCQDHSGLSPLQEYLHNGGRHMSKVLVKHKVKVDISCGDPFENSTLHLVSYHKLHYLHYLYQFLLGDKHWQKYLQLEHAIFDFFLDEFEEVKVGRQMETIRTGDGPLTLAIKSHPKGVTVIDECYDADGYNAFHRAAQGANVIAIQRFLSWGANPTLKTTNGATPLLLSILYAVKYRPFLNLDQRNVLTVLEVEMASMSASAILDHLLQNGTVHIGCDKTRSDLTVYHMAATRGMWQFIAHLLSEKRRVTGLDVDCPNKDGITPMYLAKFIGGEECEWRSPWCNVVDVIKEHGGVLRYPTLEAEYFLIFNIYFGMSPGRLFLELTDQEILTLQNDCGREECRDYRTGPDADLSRKSEELDRVYSDYSKKVDKCATCSQDCLPEIEDSLPHLASVMCFLGRKLPLKMKHFELRKDFVTFLDKENERVKKLLVAATRPHAAESCSKGQSSNQTIDGDNLDMCSGERMDLEVALRNFYRKFKQSFDLLAKTSEPVKCMMFSKGYLPRVLAKLRKALFNYDTTQSCDWQMIATKYVQLSFQVRNLNFWRLAVLKTSTIPSVSGFLSSRMEKVFMEPSKESVKLVLKLASNNPSKTSIYLRILRFTKPPLQEGTLEPFGNFG